MQAVLFILGFLSGIAAIFFALAGQTNTDMIMAALAAIALLICLAAIGIISAVERACETQDEIADAFRRIADRRAAK